MKSIFLGAWILVLPCLGCLGQTNVLAAAIKSTLGVSQRPAPINGGAAHSVGSSQPQRAPVPSHLLFLPELTTHDLPFNHVNSGAPSLPPAHVISSSTDTGLTARQVGTFERIEREGLLRMPAPVFDSEIAHKINAAFRPEIIHMGHVEIYSSVVNAIARKNPLCLLDPMILNVSF